MDTTLWLEGRRRPQYDFVIVPKAFLCGYRGLSDGAKLTYQVIAGFDWPSGIRGGRKGYVFPSAATLAQMRGTTVRSIQRHIQQLVRVGLLRRVRRPNRPSYLVLNPIAAEEETLHRVRLASNGRERPQDVANDRNVRGEATELSFPSEEENVEQDEISVNARIERVANALAKQRPSDRVTFHPPSSCSPPVPADERLARREYLASEMLKVLGDEHSLGCYRAVAATCPESLVFEALSLVKDAARCGRIRKSRGALFVALVKRLCSARGIALQLGTLPRPPNGPSARGKDVLEHIPYPG
jgi:hypothetical protein